MDGFWFAGSVNDSEWGEFWCVSAKRPRFEKSRNLESNERFIVHTSESTLIFLPNVRVPVRVHTSVYAFAEILKISFHTNVHMYLH